MKGDKETIKFLDFKTQEEKTKSEIGGYLLGGSLLSFISLINLTNINQTNTSTIEHEATVSKISEEQLFYLMSRGLSNQEATEMIVMGFLEPFTRELPMEYAVELNQLLKLDMSESIG